ncbi:MAG TPA: hypothetical protein VMV21_05285 [Vicinamibacteria bacterium]|nr:hypothetical protein [Vicinamibacteria bacterium]
MTVDDRGVAFTRASRVCRAIVWGGLVAGVLDITDAFVAYGVLGVSPVRIMQSIASGLLGSSAYAGGAPTAALGLFLHFVIAFGAATAYSLASLKLRALVLHPVRYGLAFGVGVYLFMNYLVLPLSAFKKGSGFSLPLFVNGVLAVVLLVGLPIGLLTARFLRTEGTVTARDSDSAR